jgi:uncharacterized protein (DUF58 family)
MTAAKLKRFGGVSIVLILSVLIAAALGTAVASSMIQGAQWLLFLSAALVVIAFYASRRATKLAADRSTEPDELTASSPVRIHLQVVLDQGIALGLSGRHRGQGDTPGDGEPSPVELTG